MGRPTKLTRKVQNAVEDAISIGSPLETAATYAGISYDSLNRWRKRGQAELDRLAADASAKPLRSEARYRQFCEMIEDANANAAIGWIQVIDQAARSDPSWARYMLEKRLPEHFGPRNELTVRGDVSAPLVIQEIVVHSSKDNSGDGGA